MSELDGRVAIVTGGAKGIGLGCVEQLSAAGASVVIADIDLDAAQASVETLDGPAHAVEHDVRSADSARNLTEVTLEQFGRIDILVNNAGLGPIPTPINEMTEAEWDRVMDVNTRGVFLTTRAVVPELLGQESGRIINISSIVGQRGAAMAIQYSASKFAVIGMTQSLAYELAPKNITANVICPGVLETELHSKVVHLFGQIRGNTDQEVWEWFQEKIPLGRFQTPTDIGDMAVYLASERAKNITGASFNVDGGWEMH